MTETAAPTLDPNRTDTIADLIDPERAQTMVLEDLAALRPALEKIAIDPPAYASISHTKRFLERWSSDYRFQAKFQDAPQEILDEWDFKLTVDEARWLTDPNFIVEHPDVPMPERVREYGEWNRWKFINRDLIKLDAPAPPNWKKWRQRQINRLLLSSGAQSHRSVVHAPWTAELSRGCSVGCWFCGVDAAKFAGAWPYTEENAREWRGFLKSMYAVAGDGGQHGFCYWATDPLDNPDWLDFLGDFHATFGSLPQTTTAMPFRNVEFTRKVLEFYAEHGQWINRFSVTTKKDFEMLHKNFSEEELKFWELIPQFENRAAPKATAGRVRKLVLERLESERKIAFDYNLENPGSISCVSGFLCNLPERRVRLISPVPACDRWPLGYYVYADETWDHIDELQGILENLIRTRMKTTVDPTDPLHPAHQVSFDHEGEDVLVLQGCDTKIRTTGMVGAGIMAEFLNRGTTAIELASALHTQLDPWQVFHQINRVFHLGAIADEPAHSEWEPESAPLTIGASS